LTEGKRSRRELFRLLGKPFAAAAGGPPAPPAEEAPVEGGRLVVDLSRHPLPPGTGRRFRGTGAPGSILLARVSADHLAAVGGDCPACGGALRFDGARDAVLCPGCGAAFRLDGRPADGGGGGGASLRSHACRSAGPRVEIDAIPL